MPFVPADPAGLGIPLDPALVEIRAGLATHRRRLWLRRACAAPGTWPPWSPSRSSRSRSRSGSSPSSRHRSSRSRIPVVGLLVLLVLVVRARPTLGETALAVDAESGAGDAVASALAFAAAMPDDRRSRPRGRRRDDRGGWCLRPPGGGGTVRAPPAARRADQAPGRGPGPVPPAPRPASGDRCAARRGCSSCPRSCSPTRWIGHRAEPPGPRGGRAPGRAHRRDRRGPRRARAPTPTTRAPSWPRSCASSPSGCATTRATWTVNLAQLGSVEDEVRAQLDPANEQRAASIAALSPRPLAARPRASRRPTPAAIPR